VRKTCDFAHVRPIDVDLVTGKEGTSELRSSSSGLAQRAGTRSGRRLQLHVTRRRRRRGRNEIPDAGAGKGKASKQEGGAAVVHPFKMRALLIYWRTKATATSPTICKLSALTLSIVSSVVCQ